MMLGLGSVGNALAVWLCLILAVSCVVYGAVNWNRKGSPDRVHGDRDAVITIKKS